MSQAFLVDQETRYPIEKQVFLIGRQAPADLIVPLPPISRQHARIVLDGNHYSIVDLGSRNGTFVNGEPVGKEPRRLRTGDQIVLAGVATLAFHNPAETTEASPVGKLHGVWIDEARRAVWVDGRPVSPPLSASQFELLLLLYRAPGKIITRDAIVAAVWPSVRADGVSEEAIDGLIKRLRARLRETQPAREYIQVVRGQGVRLAER